MVSTLLRGSNFMSDFTYYQTEYISDLAVCVNCSRICEDGFKELNGETFCYYEIENKKGTSSEEFGCYPSEYETLNKKENK
tara:strand:+ start:5855 stop:6097 length:243 start_codon:yes stop_codon:yes gene_type:complete